MAYDLIGKNFTPPDIYGKVTGKAKYAEDFRADGMVFCRLLTSPMPHAKVKKVDTTAALKLKGVPARLLYFPDENHWVLKPENSRLWHREVFAYLEKYIGHGTTGGKKVE